MITLTPQREHAHDHGKQGKMHCCRKKAAREDKIIEREEDEVRHRKGRSPALGNQELVTLGQQISATRQRGSDEDDGRKIEAAGACQRGKPSKHKQIEREFEVMVDGSLERIYSGLGRLDCHSF